MNGLLGQKLGMTQVLASGGRMVPVTVIEAGPCRVAQVKTAERDGYAAVQVAFQEIPDRKSNHFHGGPRTYGSMFHRAPGSIGSSSSPSRVWKNMKMGGHMGDVRVTTQGLEVVDVRSDENLIFIRGSVPGARGAVLEIRKSKKVPRVAADGKR